MYRTWAAANAVTAASLAGVKPINGASVDAPMVFAEGTYKPRSWAKPSDPRAQEQTWVASYERFRAGESISAIGDKAAKPVKPVTVLTHMLTAITHGRCLDLRRLLG